MDASPFLGLPRENGTATGIRLARSHSNTILGARTHFGKQRRREVVVLVSRENARESCPSDFASHVRKETPGKGLAGTLPGVSQNQTTSLQRMLAVKRQPRVAIHEN